MDDKNIKFIPVNGQIPDKKKETTESSNNNIVNNSEQDQIKEAPNKEQLISVNMSEIIPQSKESNEEESSNTKELNIEQPNPFDIGISSNNPEIIPTTTVPNTTQVSNNTTEPNGEQLTQSNLETTEDVIPMQTFLVNIILFAVPIVGLVLGIKKYLDKTETNKNFKNFIEAELLINAVLFALIIIIMLGSVIGNMSIN